MKYFWSVLMAAVMCSCAGPSFFQVYEVKSDDVPMKGKNFVFENEDVEVVYDFCMRGGSLSFVCRNKTERTIFLSMPNSFFIKNGMAYDYYEDKEYSKTYTTMVTFGQEQSAGIGSAYVSGNISGISVSSGGSSMGIMSSSLRDFNSADIRQSLTATKTKSVTSGVSNTVLVRSSKVIAIPPYSAKIIRSYTISTDYLIQCGEDKATFRTNYPKKSSPRLNYSSAESPVVFRNHIAYSFDETDKNLKTFDNAFYVGSLQNFAEKEVLTKNRNTLNPVREQYIIPCDAKGAYTFKIADANTFFNKCILPSGATANR